MKNTNLARLILQLSSLCVVVVRNVGCMYRRAKFVLEVVLVEVTEASNNTCGFQ